MIPLKIRLMKITVMKVLIVMEIFTLMTVIMINNEEGWLSRILEVVLTLYWESS